MPRGKSSANVRGKGLRFSRKPKIKRMTGGGGLEYLGNRGSVSGTKRAKPKRAKPKRKKY